MKKELKGAGKGSARRKEDFRKVQENWDEINWHDKWCAYCGKFTNHASGNCSKLTERLK